MGRKSSGTLALVRRHWQFFVQHGHSETSVLPGRHLSSFIRHIRNFIWVKQTRGIPIALWINILQATAQKQAKSAGLWPSLKAFRQPIQLPPPMKKES